MRRYDSLVNYLGKSPIFINNVGLGEQGAILKDFDCSIFVCPDSDYAYAMQSQL